MDLFITVITTVTSFTIGLFVYLKNRKSSTNIYFSVLIFCIGFYTIFNYLSLHSDSDKSALFWAKLILLSAIPQGPLFYSFVRIFPNNKFLFNKKIQIGILIWTLINIVFVFLGLTFKSVKIINGAPAIQPGSAIILFGLLQGISIIAGAWVLLQKYKHSIGLVKLQLRYITYGILISFGLMLFSTIILPFAFHVTFFIPLSPLYLLIAGVAIAYSIVRHRLLDIRLIVARSVAYFLFIFLVFAFITLVLSLIGSSVVGTPLNPYNLLSSVLLALIVTFSFRPVEGFFEGITEKVFYKHQYDPNTFLRNLGHITSSTLSLSLLAEMVLKELLSQMKVSFAFLILTRKGSIIWVKGGGNIIPNPEFNEKELCVLIDTVAKSQDESILIFDELDESEKKRTMREHDLSILLPLIVKDEVIGAILIGEKASGDIYTSEDLDVMKILAPEVAVAVGNALSYEEIKRFNVTLEQEVKQATEELTNANERLQQLDKLKDEFVSLASHELRTPMTIIKSYLWLILQGRVGELNPKQKIYLERTYASTDRLIKLVNDMLNVSRIESGRFVIDVKPVNLKELADNLVSEIFPRAQEQGISLTVEEPKEKIPEVIADSEKIEQVLINLIGNSLKFTPKNGKITVSFSSSDGVVETHVSDTGSGIKKEDISKLFQKFGVVGADYLKKQNSQGTGLGLYLSKAIIELHGGKMWVDSEGEDKGSVFSFSLKKA